MSLNDVSKADSNVVGVLGTGLQSAAQVAGTASQQANAVPQPPINQLLLARVEALIAKIDDQAKAEEAKAKAWFKNFMGKHWPWMAGVAAAATRFIHL